MSLMKLQNGSDIRGVAMEGISGESVNFTVTEVAAIAESFAKWLSTQTEKPCEALTIALGRDSRLTGEVLMKAASERLIALGVTVLDSGIASTPAMYMATKFSEFKADGSVMFTASHLPFNRNGMKFFTKNGGLEKGDITVLLSQAQTDALNANVPLDVTTPLGTCQPIDLIGTYTNHLVQLIRREATPNVELEPLKGCRIIVDAGNGAGGFFVNVLESLGADTTGSAYLDPDGRFPNHIPNPEDDSAMKAVIDATLLAHADLGIIFDTDVDRAAVVDHNGQPINRNKLIALLAAILVKTEKSPIIVTDSVTSDGLAQFIQGVGGIHHRFKRGYKNVINEAARLYHAGKNAPLAIETSGHGAFRENDFLDDGAYIVAKILIEMARLKAEGKTIESLIANLNEPIESGEFRLKIKAENFQAYGQSVIDALILWAQSDSDLDPASDNFEGIRLKSKAYDGWFLVRLSLHDPVLAINIESNQVGGVNALHKKLTHFLSAFDQLDGLTL